jgi:hypothetical protein
MMIYGRLLAVLGYSLKAGESFASQPCAHLLECQGVWLKRHTLLGPAAYVCV